MTASDATLRAHLTLDIVRGVAVMGILLGQHRRLRHPGAAYFNRSAYGGHDRADLAFWLATFS